MASRFATSRSDSTISATSSGKPTSAIQPELLPPWWHRPAVSRPRWAENNVDRREPGYVPSPVDADLIDAGPCHSIFMPSAFRPPSTKSRTEYCLPVAMTKSSGVVLLQHQPLRPHVVPRMAPVAPRIEIAEMQGVLQPDVIRVSARVILRETKVSPRSGDSWLKRIPLQANNPVGLTIVHRDPVGIHLGGAVGERG